MVKKKTKKISLSEVPRSFDEKYYGEEPKFFDGIPGNDRELAALKALNWYNYFFSLKELKKDVIEYAKKELGFDSKKIKAMRASEDFITRNSAASYVRMNRNGWELSEKEAALISKNAEELVASGLKKLEKEDPVETDDTTVKAKPNPQQFMLEKFNKTIGQDLFDLETEWVEGNYKATFDAYKLIKQYELKGSTLNYIVDWVNVRLEEFEVALGGKDPEVNEAYAHIKKTELRAIIKQLKTILSDVEKSKQTQKATRTTRKKAKPSVDKLLERFQYKEDDSELKVASVNPANIIGAKRVVVFNSKYNTLTEFISEKSEGLTVKAGTSYIENYSEEHSRSLSIPKKLVPEAIQTVLTKTQRQFNNFLVNKVNKEKRPEVARRVNKETIILKAE